MRHIQKQANPPDSIRDYLANQTPVGHGLDYRTFSTTASPFGGSRGGQLCRELVQEQFGLCAYTGAGIDGRLGREADPNLKYKFIAHNEHLKPQSVCRQELKDAGKTPGVDLGDDMNYQNIVAALEVSGGDQRVHRTDRFGATHRENDPVAVLPTSARCEQVFVFDANGGISSADQDGSSTIKVLNLNHETLSGWRKNAISVFEQAIQTRADAEEIINRTTTPTNGQLPEYAFAIRWVVQTMLDSIP